MAAGASFAQDAPKLSAEAEKECTDITRTMANALHLNELGYIKLKALNRERYTATLALMQAYKNDQQQLTEKLQAVASTYEQQILSFLNEKQLQAYATYKVEVNASSRFVAFTQENTKP